MRWHLLSSLMYGYDISLRIAPLIFPLQNPNRIPTASLLHTADYRPQDPYKILATCYRATRSLQDPYYRIPTGSLLQDFYRIITTGSLQDPCYRFLSLQDRWYRIPTGSLLQYYSTTDYRIPTGSLLQDPYRILTAGFLQDPYFRIPAGSLLQTTDYRIPTAS